MLLLREPNVLRRVAPRGRLASVGDDDGELLYADLDKAEAEREAEEAARLEAERLAAAERAKLVGASIKKKLDELCVISRGCGRERRRTVP